MKGYKMKITINAADVIKAQQFKKEMSVEDFSKTDEFKTLEQAGLMSVEPNKLYSKSVKTLKLNLRKV
jgi:hypothetical protein|tara:strand:- start:181 stop:384 length:204 start_codon:yes stop_codon:yes gene_type:complete